MFYLPGPEAVKAVMERKGYKVFEGSRQKGYDLNIFGVRAADTAANTFNDWLGVMYLQSGVWNMFAFPGTTDPGLYWREHPMNVHGTALVKPGQYRGLWKRGRHQGKYEALVQASPISVYRDANRNATLEPREETVQVGMFGINMHRANPNTPSVQVNKWSAGCQVFADPIQFDFMMALVRKSQAIWGDRFSYTLLTEADFS